MFWRGRFLRCLVECRSQGVWKTGMPSLAYWAYFIHLYNQWTFGRNIAKMFNHIKTFYVAFESWNCQLQHHIRIILIQLTFFLDIHAERSAITQSRYFSRNIVKTIYRIIAFLDTFESWHCQLQHHQQLFLYNRLFLRYLRRKIDDHREIPRAGRFIKIYINHPDSTYFHSVNWHLEIPSRLGGVL